MADKAQRFGSRKAPTQKSTPKSTPKLMGAKEDTNWQARDDAEAIARAAAIKADPTRRSAAAKEAGKMADEKAAHLRALRGLARSR